MQVNVLGTPYEVVVKKYDEDEAFGRRSIDGYCDGFVKKIVACDLTSKEDWKHEEKATIDVCQKQILRHEIVHAFLNESGLQANAHSNNNISWAYNEEMVDWIALQGEKIYKAWQEVNAI